MLLCIDKYDAAATAGDGDYYDNDDVDDNDYCDNDDGDDDYDDDVDDDDDDDAYSLFFTMV